MVKIKVRVSSSIYPIAGLQVWSAVCILPVMLVPNHSLYANCNPTYRTTTTAG